MPVRPHRYPRGFPRTRRRRVCACGAQV